MWVTSLPLSLFFFSSLFLCFYRWVVFFLFYFNFSPHFRFHLQSMDNMELVHDIVDSDEDMVYEDDDDENDEGANVLIVQGERKTICMFFVM